MSVLAYGHEDHGAAFSFLQLRSHWPTNWWETWVLKLWSRSSKWAYFEAHITPFLQNIIPEGFFYDLLVGQYGVISMGLAYGLAIVLPVVSTFFLAFSFLEDCGYLPRLSILSDRLLRAMGLHGKGFPANGAGIGLRNDGYHDNTNLELEEGTLYCNASPGSGYPLLCSTGRDSSDYLWHIRSGADGSFCNGPPAADLGWTCARPDLSWQEKQLRPGAATDPMARVDEYREKDLLEGALVSWQRQFLSLHWEHSCFSRWTGLGLLAHIISAGGASGNQGPGFPADAATVFLMGFLRRDYGAAGLFDMARQGQLDTIQTVVGLVVMTLVRPLHRQFFRDDQGTGIAEYPTHGRIHSVCTLLQLGLP